MKKLILLLFFVTAGIFSAQSQVVTPSGNKKIQTLQDLTITLVSNVETSSFKNSWTARYDTWKSDLKKALTLNAIGTLILEFETQLSPDVFTAGWSTARPAWVAKCQTAKFAMDLSKALLTVEMNILPEKMKAAWASQKPEWVVKCGNMK